MILGSDHQKMSKSRGNVVNPDEVIKEYGTDTLRAYILFIGPLDTDAPWSTEGINGVNRFIKRMWNQFIQLEGKMPSKEKEIEKEIEITTDKWVQKITDQAEKLKFNTMISSFMEWLNYLSKITQEDPEIIDTKAYREAADTFITMIAPATPFVAEELYHRLGGTGSIHTNAWPKPKGLYKEEKATIIVQVNGKLRDKVEVALGSELEEVLDLIKKSDKITKLNINFDKAKYVFVKDKLLNIVI
jgi:leucyl-tRNA synthetase